MYRKPRRMFPIIGIVLSLLIIAFGLFGFFYKFTGDRDGRATGEIIWTDDADGGGCLFEYTFEVDSITYYGGDIETSARVCDELDARGKVTVAYRVDDPKDNTAWNDREADFALVIFFELLGLGILAACIVRLRYIHLNFDTTGDGIGDNKPATDEQMKTIENGMRELGQFYAIPKKRLTHEQAKQATDNINKQIAAMRERKKL